MNVFKLYNLRKVKSNLILYLFVMLSVITAVSISLSIPQVISETNRHLSSQLKELNGADLKIKAPYDSSEFNKKLDTLKSEGVGIRKSTVYATNINKVFSSLIVGDYGLKDNEIILSKTVADELKIKKNDRVTIGSRIYKVKAIENSAQGVDSQSEMVGYGKVSLFNATNEIPYATLIMIDCKESDSLKEELKKIEPGYTYSTIRDKKNDIQDKLDLNAATLNILNTMSCIMTILSVISSIFMIIVYRRKDIAILRMISIRTSSIKKALRAEFFIMIFIPVIIGSVASDPLARILLSTNGINYYFDSGLVGIILSGFLLYIFIYFIFIKIATIAIEAVSPLLVIRNEVVSWKKSKLKIVILSVLFTIITLIVYGIYLGRGSALISSLAIIISIMIFFVITIVCIKLFSYIRFKTKSFLYGVKSIKTNIYSFVLIVLSFTLTIWFVLIGFTLEKTIRDSYSTGIQQKVNYNYLMVSDNSDKLEYALKKSPEVEGYTKLYRYSGVLLNNKDSRKSIQMFEINKNEYQIKYKILEGENVFEGSEKEVLISSEFSKEVNLKLGDNLKIGSNGKIEEYRIKGIYEAGGINATSILKPTESKPEGSIMYILKADSSKFTDNLKDVLVMHISTMGMSIMNKVRDFLSIFKWLCLICIFSAVLFNINIVYMNFINEYNETVIIRALGIGKGILYKSLALKFLITIVLSILMSLGLYSIMMKLVLTAAFKVNLNIAASTIILPIGCAFILSLIIFMVPFNLIRKSEGFEELREQV